MPAEGGSVQSVIRKVSSATQLLRRQGTQTFPNEKAVREELYPHELLSYCALARFDRGRKIRRKK